MAQLGKALLPSLMTQVPSLDPQSGRREQTPWGCPLPPHMLVSSLADELQAQR